MKECDKRRLDSIEKVILKIIVHCHPTLISAETAKEMWDDLKNGKKTLFDGDES